MSFEVTVDEDVWKVLPEARKAEVRALKPKLAADPSAAGDKVRRELIPKRIDGQTHRRADQGDDALNEGGGW